MIKMLFTRTTGDKMRKSVFSLCLVGIYLDDKYVKFKKENPDSR